MPATGDEPPSRAAAAGRQPTPATCPAGHALLLCTNSAGTYAHGWFCDSCSMRGELSNPRWSCEACAGSDATASTLRSSSGSGTGSGDSSFQSGDQLLSAPSPAPVPLGPPPTEAAPVPGTRRFCSPSALFTVCGAVWLAQRVWRELVLMHVGGALLQARAARRLQAEPEVEQAATTHESHSS